MGLYSGFITQEPIAYTLEFEFNDINKYLEFKKIIASLGYAIINEKSTQSIDRGDSFTIKLSSKQPLGNDDELALEYRMLHGFA